MRAGRTIKQAAIYPYEGLGHRCGADRQSAVSERTGEPAFGCASIGFSRRQSAVLARARSDARALTNAVTSTVGMCRLRASISASTSRPSISGIWRSQIRQPVRDTTSDARNAGPTRTRAPPRPANARNFRRRRVRRDHRRQWIRDRRLRVKRHPCLWRRGRNGPSRALLPKLPAYRHAAAPPSYLRMGMPGAVHGPFDEDPGNARC